MNRQQARRKLSHSIVVDTIGSAVAFLGACYETHHGWTVAAGMAAGFLLCGALRDSRILDYWKAHPEKPNDLR